MRMLLRVMGITVAAAAVLSLMNCGKKSDDDEGETVEANALILPLNTDCGDAPCVK